NLSRRHDLLSDGTADLAGVVAVPENHNHLEYHRLCADLPDCHSNRDLERRLPGALVGKADDAGVIPALQPAVVLGRRTAAAGGEFGVMERNPSHSADPADLRAGLS